MKRILFAILAFIFLAQLSAALAGIYLTPGRGYDPNLGQWLSHDPIGETGGVNLYAYVSNDPINLTDPLGLKPGDLYATKDAAAIDAINSIQPQSNRTSNMEGLYTK